MNHIIVSLMNTPQVIVDDEKRVFPYRKVEGLFYYLCMKKRITRDEATGIFWADSDEQSARKNLRDAIYHIKKIVGTDIVTMDGNVFISINPSANLQVDVDQIKENILEHYKGEFLRYFYIKNCLEFENWMDENRRELRELYIKEALKQVEIARQDMNVEQVLHFAYKLLESLYLDESLYRDIMGFLLKEGEYSFAISLYQKLEAAVRQDLDAEPEAETRALMEKVLKLRKKVTEKPDREKQAFFGRQKELYDIYDSVQRRLIKREAGSPNVILISGEAGVGKTSLIKHVQSLLEQEQFTIFNYCCYASEKELYLKSWNDILSKIQVYCKKQKKDAPGDHQKNTEEVNDYRLFITQYGIHLESFLRTFCEKYCPEGFVLFLDDIQWMDTSSLQQLNNLVFRLHDCPIMFVAVSRLEHVRELTDLKVFLKREALLKELVLNHFSFKETKELIEARAAALIKKPGQAEEIYHYTGGNALFLTELLRMVQENEEGANVLSDSGMSDRMKSIIESRLSNLPDEELELLNQMAIFPNGVTVEGLMLLSSQPELTIFDLLERLLGHQLIIERIKETEIIYEITHVLYKNYMLSQISAGRKRVYNREVAKYYEQQYMENHDINVMPALIYHYQNAGDLYKKYLYKLEYIKIFFAGKEEIYPSMSASITDQFFLPDLKSGENILIPLAEEIRALPENVPIYQQLRMMVEYLIGRYDLSSGDYKKGLRNISNCILAAQHLNNQSYLMDSYLQMIYYAIQVYDLNMMWTYINLCKKLLKQYHFPELSEYIVERLEALYHIKSGNYQEATQILDVLIPKLEKLHVINTTTEVGLTACYNYRGEIHMKLEQWDEALTYITKAVSCCPPQTPTAGLGMSYTDVGIILYRMDYYDKAYDYFKKAQNCFQNLSIHWGRTKEEAYSALLNLKLGKVKQALDHYSTACKYAGKDYSPNTKAILQEVYLQLKQIPDVDAQPPPPQSDVNTD